MNILSRKKKILTWPARTLSGAITLVFSLLLWLTIFFAVTSPNLILGKNVITGAGTTLWTTGWFFFMFITLILWEVSDRFRSLLRYLFVDHSLVVLTIVCLLVVSVQIIFVSEVHPPIGWDVGALHQGLSDTTSPNIRAYFSLNYNNLPILLVQNALAGIARQKSWLFFDWVTLYLVDLSAIINIFSIYAVDHSNKKFVKVGILFHCAFLLLFPTIIVPYTDAWVLPLVSIMIFCTIIAAKETKGFFFRIVFSILNGIATAATFFIKPSAIIPIIAFTIISLIYICTPASYSLSQNIKSEHNRSLCRLPNTREIHRALHAHLRLKLFCVLVITWIVAGGSYLYINKIVTNQTYIRVDKNREIPPIHFVSMGASKQGGYNPKDALMMAVLPTKKDRSDYSWLMFKKRIGKRGILGNLSFYIMKHRNNTADGSFAWVKEGNFIRGNGIPKDKGIRGWFEQFVYLYGNRIGDFRFWAQIWWCFLLITIGFGYHERSTVTQFLRLTIVGGFIYLLIFEGGRSRYIIQFLPAILVLAPLLYQNSYKQISRGWERTKQRVVQLIKINV